MTVAPATKQRAVASPTQVAEIERLGFGFDEVASFDLDTIDVDRRVQVREANNYAHKDEVEAYAQQMKQVPFPALVVTRDGVLVDGGTRKLAAQKAGIRFFPVIVLRLDWETADAKTKVLIEALSATLNNTSGRRQDPKEARVTVMKLIGLNWK